MPIDIEKCQELISSATAGDIENVLRLLQRTDVDVNYVPDGNLLHRYTGSALYHAIENSHEEVVRALVQHSGLNINLQDVPNDWHGDLNALCHAIIKGSDPIVYLVMQKNPDVNNECNPPLSFGPAHALGHAIVADNEASVRMLMERDDILLDYFHDMPVVHGSIYYSSPEILNILLERGANVHECDMDGRTPLQFAMEEFEDGSKIFGVSENVEILLKHGAAMSLVEYLEINPPVARFMSKKKLPQKIESLLHNDFDINYPGRCGITPLMLAAINGEDTVVDQMIAKGADITAVNKFGGTALTMAVQQCRSEDDIAAEDESLSNIMESLLRVRESRLAADMFLNSVHRGDEDAVCEMVKLRKIDVNNTDENGKTALIIVAEHGNLKMTASVLDRDIWLEDASSAGLRKNVRAPLEHLPKLEAKDHGGKTAFFHACENKKFDVADYLLSKGADIDARDNNGNAVLAIASAHGDLQVVKYLLQKNAQVDSTNHLGQSPLMLVCGNGSDISVAKMLLAYGAKVDLVDAFGRTMFDFLEIGYKDRPGSVQFIELRLLLGREHWEENGVLTVFHNVEDHSLVDQDEPNDFFSGTLRARAWSADEESGDCKKRFIAIDDDEVLVQLPAPAAPGTEAAHGDAAPAVSASSADAGLGTDEQDCVVSPGAMDHYHL